MTFQPQPGRAQQRGIVLVASLLLLIVVTIMALSIFRSFGVQEKIAGNMREKQRALQAAISTEGYAEWWLAERSNARVAIAAGAASTASTPCNALVDANLNLAQVQICSNTMASLGQTPVNVPWTRGAVSYAPSGASGMNVTGAVNNANVIDVYPAKPAFFITDLGAVLRGAGEVYQIDAYSYGLSANTAAVVESTVAITCQVCKVMGP